MNDHSNKILSNRMLIEVELFGVSDEVVGKLHRYNSRIFTGVYGRPLHILKRACDRSYDFR